MGARERKERDTGVSNMKAWRRGLRGIGFEWWVRVRTTGPRRGESAKAPSMEPVAGQRLFCKKDRLAERIQDSGDGEVVSRG